MEARYAFRKTQLLDECQVAPEIFEQVIPRLYTFMEPFVKTFQGQAAAQHGCCVCFSLPRRKLTRQCSRLPEVSRNAHYYAK